MKEKKNTPKEAVSTKAPHIGEDYPVTAGDLALAYEKALETILENDDEDAKDNLSDYMDELKEESETVGRPPKGSKTGKKK